MRLLDALSRGTPCLRMTNDGPVEAGKLPPLPSDLQKIECSNVSEYLYSTSQEVWSVYDFPNYAPPFDTFFMEWRLPKESNSEGKIASLPIRQVASRVGTLCLAMPVDNEEGQKHVRYLMQYTKYKPFMDLLPKAKWTCMFSLFSLGPVEDYVMIWPSTRFVLVASDGTYLEDVFGENGETGFSDSTRQKIVNQQVALYWPAFLSLSFLHCKNVVMESEMLSDKARRGAMARYGVPLHRFKVLDILPMKQVLKNAGGDGANHDLKRALHICRGHFKDYRKSGLFGKIKEMFWWDSHVRGSKEFGEIEHEYRIHEKKENE